MELKVLINDFLNSNHPSSDLIVTNLKVVGILYNEIVPKAKNLNRNQMERLYYLLFLVKSQIQFLFRTSLNEYIDKGLESIDQIEKMAFRAGCLNLGQINSMMNQISDLLGDRKIPEEKKKIIKPKPVDENWPQIYGKVDFYVQTLRPEFPIFYELFAQKITDFIREEKTSLEFLYSGIMEASLKFARFRGDEIEKLTQLYNLYFICEIFDSLCFEFAENFDLINKIGKLEVVLHSLFSN